MPGGYHRVCCCNVGEPCEFCAGVTPAKRIATASGILLCGACDPINKRRVSILSGGLNGTWELSQWPGFPCYWFAQIAVVRTSQYSDAACTVLLFDTDLPALLILMRYGTPPLSYWRCWIRSDPPLGFGFFFDQVDCPVDEDCRQGRVFTNDYLITGCLTSYFGYDGTVTIDAL